MRTATAAGPRPVIRECSSRSARRGRSTRVLGPEARVASRRELQRRRSRRSVAVELADGSRLVVKYDWRAERVAQEASRLGTANSLEGIDTPRLRGSTRHYLVQDFVAGDGLDALAKRSPGENSRRIVPARGARARRDPRQPARRARCADSSPSPARLDRLAARVRRAWREIETRGFPRWEAQQGAVPPAWRRAVDESVLARLVSDLGAAGEGCVLGHGDFQPRHLLLRLPTIVSSWWIGSRCRG